MSIQNKNLFITGEPTCYVTTKGIPNLIDTSDSKTVHCHTQAPAMDANIERNIAHTKFNQ